MSTSPTQRTLAECRKRGWTAQVVEKWNPHARIRQDLFGCIDIVAIVPRMFVPEVNDWVEGIVGIQATSGSNHAARVTKAKAEPRMAEWVKAGGKFFVWSWKKARKTKRWELREEAVTL